MEVFTNNINVILTITLLNMCLSKIDAAFQANQRSTIEKMDLWDRKPTINYDGRRAQKKKVREGGEVPRVFHPVEQSFHETKSRDNRKLHAISDLSQENENIEEKTLQYPAGSSSSQYEGGGVPDRKKMKIYKNLQTNNKIENYADGDEIDGLLFNKNKLHRTRIIHQL